MNKMCDSSLVQGRVPTVTKVRHAGERKPTFRDGSTGHAVAATNFVVGNSSRILFFRQDLNRVTHWKSSERPLCEGAGHEDHHHAQCAVASRARQAVCGPREKSSAGFGKPPREAYDSDAIPGSVGAWRNAGSGYSSRGGYCSAQALTIRARGNTTEHPAKDAE